MGPRFMEMGCFEGLHKKKFPGGGGGVGMPGEGGVGGGHAPGPP